MPHPKAGYRDADSKRIPGVTTIIGRFKESGGLIRWAYGRGRDGEELYESRDKAAEAGTAAHEMCETSLPLNNDRRDIFIPGGGAQSAAPYFFFHGRTKSCAQQKHGGQGKGED